MKIRKKQENMICLKCCFILLESLFSEISLGILTPNILLKLCTELYLSNLISVITGRALKLEIFEPIFLRSPFWPRESLVERAMKCFSTAKSQPALRSLEITFGSPKPVLWLYFSTMWVDTFFSVFLGGSSTA